MKQDNGEISFEYSQEAQRILSYGFEPLKKAYKHLYAAERELRDASYARDLHVIETMFSARENLLSVIAEYDKAYTMLSAMNEVDTQ